MASPPRFGTTAHGQDRDDWQREKNGPVRFEVTEYPAVGGESFGSAHIHCSDCDLYGIPCACCLECNTVQSRRLVAHEICAECQARPEHDEGDTINALGLSGQVTA